MCERWMDVVGWEGLYRVSSTGRVLSLSRDIVRKDGTRQHFKQTLLNGWLTDAGYRVVRLSHYINGRKMARIHRLVALAFLPNPENKPEVNHIDSDRANNFLENLEWVTSSENRAHSYHFGDVSLPHLKGESFRALAREYSVDRRTITDVIRGVSWAHVPAPPKEES